MIGPLHHAYFPAIAGSSTFHLTSRIFDSQILHTETLFDLPDMDNEDSAGLIHERTAAFVTEGIRHQDPGGSTGALWAGGRSRRRLGHRSVPEAA